MTPLPFSPTPNQPRGRRPCDADWAGSGLRPDQDEMSPVATRSTFKSLSVLSFILWFALLGAAGDSIGSWPHYIRVLRGKENPRIVNVLARIGAPPPVGFGMPASQSLLVSACVVIVLLLLRGFISVTAREMWIDVCVLLLGVCIGFVGLYREMAVRISPEAVVLAVLCLLVAILVRGGASAVSRRVLVRRALRRGLPHCRKCGYDLTGNVSGRCPECGWLIWWTWQTQLAKTPPGKEAGSPNEHR